MKEWVFIKENFADRVTYYLLLVFVMVLPFDRLYSELALGSLVLHTCIHLKKTAFSRFRVIRMFVPSGIYLLTLVGTAYSHFYDEAFHEWERQLAMLLFPLIMLLNPFDFRKYLMNVLVGLGVSCAIALLYLYANAFIIIGENHLPPTAIMDNAFLNQHFSEPIEMHATYFSMYIAIASVAMLGLAIQQPKKERWIFIVMLTVLMAGLVQLSSKAVLISFAVIINIVVPFLMFRKRARLKFMMITIFLSIVAGLVISRIDNLRTRVVAGLEEDLTQAASASNMLEPRIARWKAAVPLILESPVYGHGSGSEVTLLKEVYFEKKLYNSYLHELNVHNEYLSMLIKTGVIGLLVWLMILGKGFAGSLRSRDALYCSFMVIIAVVSFSENILDANKGIFFFSVFFSLFYFPSKRGASQK